VSVPLFLRSLGCVLVAVLLLAPAATAAPSASRARAATAVCPGANTVPTAANLATVRAAIDCLHNRIRAQHGLPLLVESNRLGRAAAAHSADMVAHRYFEHTTPSGTTLVGRLTGGSYLRGSQDWALGENLAWGTGSQSTPASIMRGWMASPGHRANILRRAYHELGVGIVAAVPSDGTAGATFTADFGVRH
jgi:uncharacterized protein YkwD